MTESSESSNDAVTIQGRQELLRHTAEIVSAFSGNNTTAAADLLQLIQSVYRALSGIVSASASDAPQTPAVAVRKSVSADHIICLEDGKKVKVLTRHLRSEHGMTPEEYRAKWSLPFDYPMTAPKTAARRSAVAKSIGLGTKTMTSTRPRKTRKK